jgi:hypothetical protein
MHRQSMISLLSTSTFLLLTEHFHVKPKYGRLFAMETLFFVLLQQAISSHWEQFSA